MKESFEALVEALKKNRRECPWAKEQEIDKYIDELTSELNEIKEAIKNKDYPNLKEELGDLLMDLLFVTIIAEEKRHFTTKEVIDEVKAKLIRRKPWIFGDETISNKEDAARRWNEIKAEEKKRRKEGINP